MLNIQKRFVRMVAGTLSAVMITYAFVPAIAFAASHRPPPPRYGRHHHDRYHDKWTKHDRNATSAVPLAAKNTSVGASYSENSEAVNFAGQVLQLVNAERAKVGARPLQLSRDLQDAAAIRAEEITRHFAHERPDGSSCFTLLRNRNRTLGENIAAGNATPGEVVDQWMHSPGHRANILNKDFKELGVGYCRKEGTEYTHYWIQMFRG